MDFRRHGIQVQEAIARLVHHCWGNQTKPPFGNRRFNVQLLGDVKKQRNTWNILELDGSTIFSSIKNLQLQFHYGEKHVLLRGESNLQDLPSLRRTMRCGCGGTCWVTFRCHRILLAIIDVSRRGDWQREDLQHGKVQVANWTKHDKTVSTAPKL